MASKIIVSNANAPEMQKRKRDREEDGRGIYFRDTTAIIHSLAFRRLKHKTQVFFAPSNDHICTRMEHVLHVATIAMTISKELGLDSELSWAIGVGHDLGHAPFGHLGERVINRLSRDRLNIGFQHELNSLRVVDFLSNGGEGLNLSYAVRDGIVSHNGEMSLFSIRPTLKARDLEGIEDRKSLIPATYEGAVVRLSDKIAYLGRDFEDAKRLKIVSERDLPYNVRHYLGETNSEIIDSLVKDIVDSSGEEGISFSESTGEIVEELSEFNINHIYRSEFLDKQNSEFSRLIEYLYQYLRYIDESLKKFGRLSEKDHNQTAEDYMDYASEMRDKYEEKGENQDRMVFDYIAGMTDNYAIESIKSIFVPKDLK